ncbi:aldehyde dehydrogenase family protein [Brachyspira pilosicoli]|uniref:aldehyde dehydrogenase family protein n=1 Tax=Brachyspira pilosicoli TaxID=52584 RepID=UPI003004CAD0
MYIEELRNKQREFFKSGATLEYYFRIEQLKKLKAMIIKNEANFINALNKDMNKLEFEAIGTELFIIIDEINLFIKKLKTWMKNKKVKRNFLTIDSKTIIMNKPYGVSLIISPWNYPLQLTFLPLIGSIAGGNTSIILPSQLTTNVYDAIYSSVKETFNEEYITVVDKSFPAEETTKIEYDKIFFTGSPRVGKIIMNNASNFLTSLTLELGGKSPVIVDDNIKNINKALKRIIWGKFINSGQTCVSPDYLLVNKNIKDKFLEAFNTEIKLFEDERKLNRIINKSHYERLKSYLNDGKILYGGEYDDEALSLAITLLEPNSLENNVMRDEIFGSIFPIIYYNTKEEAMGIIDKVCSHPLAMYVFSDDNNFIDYFLNNISFGGASVNDTISHILNNNAPFGGVSTSGIGEYHGYYSFECFTKKTTVLKKNYNFELNTKYPPYSKNIKALKFLFELFKK